MLSLWNGICFESSTAPITLLSHFLTDSTRHFFSSTCFAGASGDPAVHTKWLHPGEVRRSSQQTFDVYTRSGLLPYLVIMAFLPSLLHLPAARKTIAGKFVLISNGQPPHIVESVCTRGTIARSCMAIASWMHPECHALCKYAAAMSAHEWSTASVLADFDSVARVERPIIKFSPPSINIALSSLVVRHQQTTAVYECYLRGTNLDSVADISFARGDLLSSDVMRREYVYRSPYRLLATFTGDGSSPIQVEGGCRISLSSVFVGEAGVEVVEVVIPRIRDRSSNFRLANCSVGNLLCAAGILAMCTSNVEGLQHVDSTLAALMGLMLAPPATCAPIGGLQLSAVTADGARRSRMLHGQLLTTLSLGVGKSAGIGLPLTPTAEDFKAVAGILDGHPSTSELASALRNELRSWSDAASSSTCSERPSVLVPLLAISPSEWAKCCDMRDGLLREVTDIGMLVAGRASLVFAITTWLENHNNFAVRAPATVWGSLRSLVTSISQLFSGEWKPRPPSRPTLHRPDFLQAHLPFEKQLESTHLALLSALLQNLGVYSSPNPYLYNLRSTEELEETLLDSCSVPGLGEKVTKSDVPKRMRISQDFEWVRHIHKLRHLVFELKMVPVLGMRCAGKSRVVSALSSAAAVNFVGSMLASTELPTFHRVPIGASHVTLVDFPPLNHVQVAVPSLAMALMSVSFACILVSQMTEVRSSLIRTLVDLVRGQPCGPKHFLVVLTHIDTFVDHYAWLQSKAIDNVTVDVHAAIEQHIQDCKQLVRDSLPDYIEVTTVALVYNDPFQTHCHSRSRGVRCEISPQADIVSTSTKTWPDSLAYTSAIRDWLHRLQP